MSNALTTIDLDVIAPQIAALLPPDVSPDRFREVALAAIRQKPDLLKCDRQSLFNAIINAAQDGLLPDGREGAIVPRKGKAVWQPMVLGIYKRVKSSGSVATLSANLVYDGETFDVLLGDDDRIVHRRDMSLVADGSEVAVYAIATLKDGTKEREVMTWEQVERVRQSSATPNDGPWVTWPGEMARKTVVRRLAKRLPVLDPADERLHSAIGRVDSLYNFGTPAQEAPPPALPAAAAGMKRPPSVSEPPPKSTPRRTIGQLLDGIKFALRDATSRREADHILDSEDVLKLRESFAADSPAIMRLDAMREEALERFPPVTDEDEALEDVEIVGADKVGAGD